MTALDELAALQDLDTHLDQLAHRRDHLPERQEIAELAAMADQLTAQRGGVQARRDELGRALQRLEDEVSLLDDKIAGESDKLYGGAITSPKEAQALQEEIASLERRKTRLEDDELELMEQAEPVDAELAGLDDRLAEVAASSEAAAGRLTAAEAEIDAELDAVGDDRTAQAAKLPAPLLDDYETRRSRSGGVVVGRLVGTTCTGCSLALPAIEIDRIRDLSPDEPLDCPECGVILVR